MTKQMKQNRTLLITFSEGQYCRVFSFGFTFRRSSLRLATSILNRFKESSVCDILTENYA